jgi:hypothetical protein
LGKVQIIEKLFSYLLEFSYLLIPILYLIGKSKGYKLNIALAIYGLVIFLFLHYHNDIPKSLRKYRQPLYTLIEYSFFAYIYYFTVSSKIIKRFIAIITIAFYVFQVIYFSYSKPQKLDSIPIGIETIILFFLAVLYFQECFKLSLKNNIYEYPSFWIVAGMLIYLSTGFFFNILLNHLSKEDIEKFWHYTYIPDILKNVLFGAAVIGHSLQKKISNNNSKKDIPNLDMI